MSMFWGLSMKPNRKYSQMIVKSFHLSSIAIDEGESAKLYLTADKQKYVVATVTQAIPQVMLDLNFNKGDNIMFQTSGDASVSLLGYLNEIEDSGDEEDDESIDEAEYAKLTKALSKSKKDNESSSDEEEEDEDDDDEDVDDSQLMKDLLSGENSSGNEEDDQSVESGEEEEVSADSDSELDSEEEEDPEPKPKQIKLEASDKKQQSKGQNGVAKNEQKQKGQKEKKPQTPAAKEESKKNQKKANDAKPAGGERVLSGGVKVEDVRVGNGPEAKQGKRASVYYLGRLKSNNKVFDSMQKGAGFKFALGAGEVIKGWDVGVAGMKVGGKRRITCPPHMAYGARGSPPTIPPNSTLVFDVELKGVN